MKHLKQFEVIYVSSKESKYIEDLLINIGVFIDSIRKTWENPDDFAFTMNTMEVKMFIKGKFFNGKDIFNFELKELDKYYVVSSADKEYFPNSGDYSEQPPDCLRYINLKIKQHIGDITKDKLEKLSKIKFTIDEIDEYDEYKKFNI